MAVVLRLWAVIGMPPVPLSADDKAQMVEGVAQGHALTAFNVTFELV